MTAPHGQKNKTPIRAVGFDWDETLFAIDRGKDFYTQSVTYGCKKALEAIGRPPETLERFKGLFDVFTAGEKGAKERDALVDDAAAMLALQPTEREKFSAAFHYYYPHYRVSSDFTGKAHLIQGAKETLEFLQDHHIPFFIASNFDQNVLRIQVQQALGDMMSEQDIEEHVLGHVDGNQPKPAPDMVLRGFKSLGITPDRHSTFFVGNSVISDMPAAIRCGTMPILFTDKEMATKAPGQEELEARNFSLEEPLKTLISRRNFDITKVQITEKGTKTGEKVTSTHMIPMAQDHAGLKEIFMRYIADFRAPVSQGQARV